jgi:hypothetical protein
MDIVVHNNHDDPPMGIISVPQTMTTEEYDTLKRQVLDLVQGVRAAERARAVQLCDRWGRFWNDLYERETRRTRGRVMFHQIGTAVWAIGKKISGEDADQAPPHAGTEE